MPKQFVLKTTHDSGGIVICKDSESFDREAAVKKLQISLERDFYLLGREWPYKNVRRRIIAEQYMVDDSGEELKDYKIFCFNGEPQFIQLDYGRFKVHHRNIYNLEWELLPFEYSYRRDEGKVFQKPEMLTEMIDLAKKLSSGIPFVRTDFYIINKHIYFGEMTFFPESGYGKFTPNFYDKKFGEILKL